MLAEHDRREGDGGDELEVQQQRRRRGGDAFEARDEQHRADRPTEHHGEREIPPTATKRTHGGPMADHGREHGKGRAHIEQPGEDQSGHVPREHRRGRRGRAEEHRGGQAAQNTAARDRRVCIHRVLSMLR